MKNIDKNTLREKYLYIRSKFIDEEIIDVSNKILNKFFKLEIVESSNSFLLYHSFGKEIITHNIIDILLEDNKKVYLPYISDDKSKLMISQYKNKADLKSGVFGIKEPVERQDESVNDIEVIVVPGLIFDKNGYRIGYGGGYYDKLLSRIKSNTITIGLGFNDFLQEKLPISEYDIPVKIIITEKQVLYIGGVEN